MLITYEKTEYDVDNNYSFKDFTGRSFTEKINDIVIYGSCFSNETPDSDIFLGGITGCTFIKCNLSNCFIPEGNETIDCVQIRFKLQNDLRDWKIDETDTPVEVLGRKYWEQKGYSIDPVDIPEKKLSKIKDIKKGGG